MTDTKHLDIAKALYSAISKKNIDLIEQYIHPDIHFISPFNQIIGKEAYLNALKSYTTIFSSLTIRTIFANDHQAMLVYDADFPEPIGKIATAVLITFNNELISKIELFFDARAFK